ncbi:MAG: hypothetical protein IJN34_06685 [Clostridia bacterium]|nr:hypothetical protein [Clostridia bacterium]
MSLCNCDCRSNCTLLALVGSLILGIVTAFLQITAVITVTPAFLWVVLGVAIGFLAITLATGRCCGCGAERNCTPLHALLFGAIGAILAAVILLGIPFAATSVVGAIITGALLFFFFLTLTSAACLARARCRE